MGIQNDASERKTGQVVREPSSHDRYDLKALHVPRAELWCCVRVHVLDTILFMFVCGYSQSESVGVVFSACRS